MRSMLYVQIYQWSDSILIVEYNSRHVCVFHKFGQS